MFKPYLITNGTQFRVRKFPRLYLSNIEPKFDFNPFPLDENFLNEYYTFNTLKEAEEALAKAHTIKPKWRRL